MSADANLHLDVALVDGAAVPVPRRLAGRVDLLRTHLRDPLFRNAWALVASTGATTLLGLGYWVLAARLYSPTDVGRGSAVISAMVLLAHIAQLNLMPALARFLPRAGQGTRRMIGRAYLFSGLAGVIAGTLFVTVLRGPTSADELVGTGWPLAVAFVASVVTWTLFTLQDSVVTGLRQAFWVPVDNMTYGILKIALLVGLATLLPGLGVFASWTLPTVASILLVNLLIFRRLIPRHLGSLDAPAEGIGRRQLLRFVAGDYLGSLFELAAVRLLPLVVVAQAGVEAAGYFYVAWVIGTALELVAINCGSSLTVEGALEPRRVAAMTSQMLRGAGLLVVPLVTLAVVAAPTILGLFGPGYAVEGSTLLRLLGLAMLPRFVTTLAMAAHRVRGHVRRIVAIQAAFATLVIGMSLALVGPYGISGIGVAYLLSSVAVGAAVVPGLVRFVRQAQR